MRYCTDAERILANAYLSLVEDALKNPNKFAGKTVRCCRCGRSDVTLRKLHKDVYACPGCIFTQSKVEADKEGLNF